MTFNMSHLGMIKCPESTFFCPSFFLGQLEGARARAR